VRLETNIPHAVALADTRQDHTKAATQL
jgi:hypothetical protein